MPRTLTMRAQQACERRHQHDVAYGLRRLERREATVASELLADVDLGALELDVLPAQGDEFAEAKSGKERCREQRAVVLGLGEEERQFVCWEDALGAVLD